MFTFTFYYRVSRKWNELTRSPVLWKKVDVEFHWSHGSQNTVAEYFVNKLPSCASHLRLNFEYHRNWTEPLDFEKLSTRLKERCPHLKMLILDSVTLSNSLSLVIDLCTVFLENVKTLAFCYSEFRQCPEKEECHGISKIEILDLLCCEFRQYNKPPFSRMPYLKQLHMRYNISAEDIDDSWFEDDSTFLNQLHVLDLVSSDFSPRTFQAIQNNGLNLTELYLCWSHLEDSFLNFSNTVFPHLETICFTRCIGVTCEGVISLIQSCQSLQNVYVNKEVAESYAAHPFVAANKCKLKIVKAGQCAVRHETEDDFFELMVESLRE